MWIYLRDYLTKNDLSVGYSSPFSYLRNMKPENIICLKSDAFRKLIDSLVVYIKKGHHINHDKWISGDEATLTNAPDTKVHYDKLGRPYKTETENYAGNYIAQTNTFNSLGQVITTSAPDANGNTLTTTYTYADAYYRLTQQANSFAITNYTYSNPASGQFKVITNIVNGEMREITTDASGMMIKATDAAGTLNYTYNSQHNLIEVKLGADIINTMTYDAVTGYQTGLSEPNSGTSTYVYNGFGELKSQTRNGQTTTLAYDVLGRPTTRTEPDGTYTYTYVTAGNGKNQLQNIKKGGVIDQQYTYDALHRVVTFDQKIDASFYTTAYEYNTYNDITKITYPGTFSVDYAYNARGMLTHIYKGGTTNVIYQVNSTNVLGQVTGYTLGNGKTSATTYQNNGMPSNFSTTGIQNLTMVFDLTTGNLTSRTDVHNGNQTEAFTYETALDRLKTIAYNGGSPVTVDYGTNGNITQKYDAGTYTYDNTKKNAVKTTSLACGVTGAQSTNPQTIVYSHFNKPLKISQNGVVDTFMYNNNHDRIKTQLTASGVTTTRLFVGNYERETKSTGGAVRHIYYIHGPDGLVCIAVKLGTNAPQYFYTYTDHLGSIVAVTNTAGVVQGEQSYDAWGRQRNADNWTDYAGTGTITLNGFVLDRGYTGHQHLKEFGIINMNGRLYDPIVGRMLNPDNFVQDATSTQAFNRYSYVVNNPLKYSDPSGWKFMHFDEEIGHVSDAVVPGSTLWQIATGGVDAFFQNYSGGGGGFTPGWSTGNSGPGYSLNDIINKLWYSTPNGHDMTYFFENGNVVDAIPGAITTVTHDENGTYYELGVWLDEPDEHGMSYYGAFYFKDKGKVDYQGMVLNNLEFLGDLSDPLNENMTSILLNRNAYLLPSQKLSFSVDKPVIVRTPIGVGVSTSTKTLNKIRVASKGLFVIGALATGYEVAEDISEGNYVTSGARATIFAIGVGASFIPGVGWGIALGIGALDYFYGNKLYDYLDKKY